MTQANADLDGNAVPNLGDENQGKEQTTPHSSILDAGATGGGHDEFAGEQVEQTAAEKPQDGQARDADGKFASKQELKPDGQPAGQPEVAAAPAHLNSALVAEAVASGYTPEQINGVPTNEMLADLVAGSRARNSYSMPPQQPQAAQQPPQVPYPYQQQPAPQQQYPQPQVQQPTYQQPQQPTYQPQYQQPYPEQQQAMQQQPAQAMELKLDDIPEEFSGPLKQVQQSFNDLKGSVIAENQQLRQALAGVQSEVQQSAELASQAGRQQAAQHGDAIAGSVPGLVEAIGKPSQAEFGSDPIARARWKAVEEVFLPQLHNHAQRFGYHPATVPQSVVTALLTDAATQLGYLSGTNGRTNNGQNRAPQGNRFQNQVPNPVPASNPEGGLDSYHQELMALVGDMSQANGIGNTYG